MDKVKGFSKWQALALHFINLISFFSVLGSLYYSEIVQIAPCQLCWYQRILVYPIFIITTIAIFLKDTKVFFYTLVLAAIATPISIYHYLLQKTEVFGEAAGACSEALPCGAENINYLGFITIPLLAAIAGLLMVLVSLAAILYKRSTIKD